MLVLCMEAVTVSTVLFDEEDPLFVILVDIKKGQQFTCWLQKELSWPTVIQLHPTTSY